MNSAGANTVFACLFTWSSLVVDVGCSTRSRADAPATPDAEVGPFVALAGVRDLSPAWTGSSINTAVFRQGSIARLPGGAYATAYFDAGGRARIDAFADDGAVRSTWVEPNLPPYLLGDGHCGINLGVSADGILHVIYGAHATVPLYAQVSEPMLLTGGTTVSATSWRRTITYPQFYGIAGELQMWFRADLGGEVHHTTYSAPTRELPLTSTGVLLPGDAGSVYMNQLAVHGTRLALSYMYRFPSTDGLVHNDGLYLLLSEDGGASWSTPRGAPVAIPSSRGDMPAFVPITADAPLNQTGSTFGPDGTLYLTWYARDGTGTYQIFVGTVDTTGVLVDVSAASDNRAAFDLSGSGTLVLPLSRPQVVASACYVHVIFRAGGNLVVASRRAGTTQPWSHVTAGGPGALGAWEPSISQDAWDLDRRLLVYVQPASQGPADTALAIAPANAQVYEFREIGCSPDALSARRVYPAMPEPYR